MFDYVLAGLMSDAARGRAEFDTIITVAARVAAKRSEWSQGQAGLAQRNGHRNAVRFVQSITGSSRGEAARQVRLGEAMGEADAAEQLLRLVPTGSGDNDSIGDASTGDGSGSELGTETDGRAASGVPNAAAVLPWSHPVSSAVGAGAITPAAGDAIVRGLGEPSPTCDIETLRAATSELLNEARTTHVDELFRLARRTRDQIDPAGVQERWQRRYDNRSWIMRRNNDELVAGWGNLVNRTISMTAKNLGAIPASGELTDADAALLAQSRAAFDSVGSLLARSRQKAAITEAMRVVGAANK